jgi:hypothetical protein
MGRGESKLYRTSYRDGPPAGWRGAK